MPKPTIAQSVVHELRFMLVLVLGIFLILGIGFYAQYQGQQGRSPVELQRQRLAAYPGQLTQLEKTLFLLGIEPVVSQHPWEIKASDLTRERVIYNVATKPGFQLLTLQLVGMLVGIGLILRASIYVLALPARAYRRLSAKVRQTDARLHVHTIYGTVHITARSGVIYISGTASALARETQDFGSWLQIARIEISVS